MTIAVCIVAGLGGLLAAPAGQTDYARTDQPSITARSAGEDDPPSRDGDPNGSSETTDRPSSAAPTTGAAPPDDEAETPEPTPDKRTQFEDEVTRLTNAERAGAGCEPVRTDERLRTAARGHSDDMASRQYFSHTSPEGETPWERAEEVGYPSPSAENIAHGYPDAEAVVTAWMASEGHRANILNCGSRAVGVGVTLAGAGAPYWTQMFGSE